MRLRSIEIGGYKSFGVRTELRFDRGMTAVVGPNGSGKSNIMDALRWVIGEGANRSLRVKRLDDVIFSGSAERAPAGLAEVRLRLDNGDGWLGLEAAEVEVQRRVHRDGESEFRLNGRAVRLREIQELFHNSGLGAGGYALMGQGLVDEVLRLRPLERRRLIEEVADVRRHRRKMLESRRQRERAEQHLERARMLRDEIEPRLRSLERQARRARRRGELEAELDTALRAWYAAAAAELAAQERERRSAAEAAADEQQRAEVERSAAAEALAAAEQAVETARAQAAAAAEQRRAAQTRLNDQRHALELDQRRREWLSGEAVNLESELGIAAPDGELGPDVATAAAALHDAEECLREARERRDQAQRERDAYAHRRAVAEALARRLEAERAELLSEADTLGAARTAQLETVAQLEADQAAATAAEAAAAEALTAARAEETRAAEELERIDAAYGEIRDARQVIEREIDDLSARIATLDELTLSPVGNGAAPRLLSRLRVQAGYEAAIEAALGAAAEAEIQPSAAAALDRAQSALQRGDQGWIGVAADLVAPATLPPTPQSHPNGAGSGPAAVAVGLAALDVIDAPANLRAVADALLGGIQIAPDAAQARALLGETSPPRAVVTRDGILLRADGVVAAQGGQSAGRARQQRRLSEWRERRGALRRELDAQPLPDEAAHAEAVQERERAAAQMRERTNAHSRALAALSSAGGALRAAEAEGERLRRDALRVAERQARVDSDAAEAARPIEPPAAGDAPPDEGELAELEGRRVQAAAEHAAARAHADQIERRSQAAARLAEVRAELHPLDAALAEREAAVAEAETAAADRAALEESRAALELAEQQRGETRQRLEVAQTTRLQAERAAVEAQAALRETHAARERLAASAEEDHIELAELASPAAEVFVDVEQLRGAAHALRERLHRLGPVQPDAAEEHEAELQRFTSLGEQISDLEITETRLRTAERELETLIDSSFRRAFDKVDAAFQRYFRLMFRGGRARLTLTQEAPPAESELEAASPDSQLELEGVRSEVELQPAGVEIVAQPPGKRVANLSQLSGGERALTAIALLFALLEIRPVPFCVLDEVDAALDEANVERFVQALKERAADIQFVVITHNRRTIEQADAVYGVTMAADGLSKVLSVRLDALPAAL